MPDSHLRCLEEAFLTGGLMLSLTLLNMGSGDAALGDCSHQLTFSRTQIRDNLGVRRISLPTADVSPLDEVGRSRALHQEWEREPLTDSTLRL